MSKQTDIFGKFIQHECDFIVLKFEEPMKQIKFDSYNMPESMDEYALSRVVKGFGQKSEYPIINEHQMTQLKTEKDELEQRLKDANDEIKRLTQDLDTANKSIYDKERQQKQDKREITHLENVLRNNKTKQQEILEQLTRKELEFKNLEKDCDNLRGDIKKNDVRFEKQRERTDLFQNKFNDMTLQNSNLQNLLTNANKIVRHKDNQLGNLEQKCKGQQVLIANITNERGYQLTQPKIEMMFHQSFGVAHQAN